MRIGILGTGMVGRTLATKLVDVGHEVTMGSREAHGEVALAWATETGARADQGSFADAARFGDVVFNCTAGHGSLAALEQAGAENLSGKLLIDVANPLDFSSGEVRLTVCNADSLGEQIQKAHPEAMVVKALNTMNSAVMVDPASVPGDHVVFVCGESYGAKTEATEMLGQLGWPSNRVIDLGGINAARAVEMYLPLWLAMRGSLDTQNFNIAISRSA